MIIRKAQSADIDGIAAIYDKIHTAEETGAATIGWQRGIYPERCTAEAALERDDLFVIEDEGHLVGTGILNQIQVDEYKYGAWKHEADDSAVMVMHTLVIDPDEKGKGYGKAFVAFYEDYARQHNCPSLRIDTNERNVAARKFYAPLGYEEVGIVPCVFNGLENVQLVMLEKYLDDLPTASDDLPTASDDLTAASDDPQQETPFITDEEFDDLRTIVVSLVEDGDLSSQDVDDITSAIDEIAPDKQLTKAQRKEVLDLAREGVVNFGKTKIALPLKIWAVLSLVGAVLLLPLTLYLAVAFMAFAFSGTSMQSTTELVLSSLQLVLMAVSCGLHIGISVMLFKRKRHHAAIGTYTLVAISGAEIFNSIMLNGVSESMYCLLGILVFQVALSAYLSPSLSRERKLEDNLRKRDVRQRARKGTLGLDLEGSGYIKLDFFNLFWVFIIGCVLGLVVEVIFHMVVVEPGVYQDRAGLMWGPFSPIYGFGCVLMTIALNRFKKANILLVFVVCTIIGGAFEYAVSWWMEVAFGATAWDYSDKFLNINGRTCLLYASMFGVLGLAWIKLLLPMVLSIINRIPWKARYSVTTVCAALMLVNCFVTVQALDCWYERCSGKEVVSDVQLFYAEHFPDDVMQQRFQSMSIHPEGGHS